MFHRRGQRESPAVWCPSTGLLLTSFLQVCTTLFTFSGFSLQVMAVLPFLLCWTPLHVLSFNMPAHSRVQSCPFFFSAYTSWVFSFSSRASHTVHVLGSSNVHLSPDLFSELHTHMSGPPFYISTWISNSISNCGPHQFLHLAHLSVFPP